MGFFFLGPDSDSVWVLVVYDLAPLSLSLSLSLTFMADLGDRLNEIFVCGSCVGWSEFVFMIFYPYEFVFLIWFLVVRWPTMCGF